MRTIHMGYSLFQYISIQAPAAALQRSLNSFQHPRFFHPIDAEAVSHHIQHFAHAIDGGHLALRLHPREAAGTQPLGYFVRGGVAR